MSSRQFSAAILWCSLPILLANAHGQQNSSDVPSLKVTSTLVTLDVTVFDENGQPVVNGLTKDDFKITENKQPQRIFSFEPAQVHMPIGGQISTGDASANAAKEDREGRTPVTIFVLDRLNCSVDEFAQVRGAVRTFLSEQPAQLSSPAEMMVIGNESLEMVQGYTRSRDDLLFALDHVETVIPFKLQHSDFDGERARQSIDALEQIAVQNKGLPARKNVVWVGPGGPNLDRASYGTLMDTWQPYIHAAVNLLVNARVSLFVIYPGMKTSDQLIAADNANAASSNFSSSRDHDIGNNNAHTGDINFPLFSRETGGALFYDRNDLNREIAESSQIGTHYYTLTYQPSDKSADGKFREIHVTLRDRNLRAVTKSGYFATDRRAPVDPQQVLEVNVVEAARSTIPFEALKLHVSDALRRPESHMAQFIVHVTPKNLGWLPTPDGKKTANLMLAVLSLSNRREILASKLEKMTLHSTADDPNLLSEEVLVRLTALVPAKTQKIRIVLETVEEGRMGTADLDRKAIEAAPVKQNPNGSLASSGIPRHDTAP